MNWIGAASGENWEIHHGDALAVMRSLSPASVDLVATDPPYFRVKDLPWDRQWDNADAFVAWLVEVFVEFQRILKPSGSLYVFASAEMAGRVEGALIASGFHVLSRIVWRKPDCAGAEKGRAAARSYLPQTERVFLAELAGPGGHGVIGGRIRAARVKAGLRPADIDIVCSPSKKPTGLCYRWENPFRTGGCIPKREQFVGALRACGDERPAGEIAAEYDSLLRPFSLDGDRYSDVWDYEPVRAKGKHPCEKPVVMMEDIILSSSRPDAVVLDPFAGSAATGEAAIKTGRRFIGVEKSPEHAQGGARRLSRVTEQGRQLGLFDVAG